MAPIPMKSIGELAREAGMAPSALRYYDRIGLLPADGKSGGKRRYGPQARRRLEVIRSCREAGFTLAEIRGLVHGRDDFQAFARRKRAALDERIRELERTRDLLDEAVACGCRDIPACVGA